MTCARVVFLLFTFRNDLRYRANVFNGNHIFLIGRVVEATLSFDFSTVRRNTGAFSDTGFSSGTSGEMARIVLPASGDSTRCFCARCTRIVLAVASRPVRISSFPINPFWARYGQRHAYYHCTACRRLRSSRRARRLLFYHFLRH